VGIFSFSDSRGKSVSSLPLTLIVALLLLGVGIIAIVAMLTGKGPLG
jgi:hypothetical protein